MRKHIEPTLVEKAIEGVPGFEQVFKKLEQQVILRGQSKSTLTNYIRCIATISLHFGKLPEHISDDEINEDLSTLALNPKSPSCGNFKHAVYRLRYYFRLMDHNKRAIALPSLKKEIKFPVILNRMELKTLFAAPTLLKHRILLTLIYSAGMRAQEAINLKIADIDFERKTITSAKANTKTKSEKSPSAKPQGNPATTVTPPYGGGHMPMPVLQKRNYALGRRVPPHTFPN